MLLLVFVWIMELILTKIQIQILHKLDLHKIKEDYLQAFQNDVFGGILIPKSNATQQIAHLILSRKPIIPMFQNWIRIFYKFTKILKFLETQPKYWLSRTFHFLGIHNNIMIIKQKKWFDHLQHNDSCKSLGLMMTLW